MVFRKNCLLLLFSLFLGESLTFSPVMAEERQTISSLEIRSLQTREFSDITQEQAYQNALSTFQDLGFIITETSKPLGLIEANQIHPNQYQVVLATFTLTTLPTQKKTIARLSLSAYPLYPGEEGGNLNGDAPRPSSMIRSPIPYQQFFDAFSYSLPFNHDSVSK